MKNYSKAYHWDEQTKSIVNLNAAMYYNLLLFTVPFSYVNAEFFLKGVDKDKFKELLTSLSWAPIVVHLLLIHLAGEELGKVFIEETCTVGGQFITPSTLPSSTISLGNECREWTQWLLWLCSAVTAESSLAGFVLAPLLPRSCSGIALWLLSLGYSGSQEKWLFFGTVVSNCLGPVKVNTGL